MGVASSGESRQVVQAKWGSSRGVWTCSTGAIQAYSHQYSGKMRGDMAMVEDGTPGTKKVCSVAPPPIRLIPPTDFLDILRRWGQTWIWDDLKVTGGTDWTAQ